MMGATPSKVLNLPPLERELAVSCATELEMWRWKQRKKLHEGGQKTP